MLDVVVIGGGQAGLAAGYFLRRAGLDFAVLDAEREPGGSWQWMWPSLHLFSPAEHSPLPGWPMPRRSGAEFPPAGHVVDYLARYEQRYDLPVHRPVRVDGVHVDSRYGEGDAFTVRTDRGTWRCRAVISATGTWTTPYLPTYPGQSTFAGRQLHTASYRGPEEFAGQRVVVVGGGNSAAQILADVSRVADTTWVARREPRLMPDDVDGRVLFDVATRRDLALRHGLADTGGVAELGDIVMVPSVRQARERGVLHAEPMFTQLTRSGVVLGDGRHRECDAVIWCTGFRPALRHLRPLALRREDGVVPTVGTRSVQHPLLHLLGYGDWTGAASATLIGAGRTAKPAVSEIAERLSTGAAASA